MMYTMTLDGRPFFDPRVRALSMESSPVLDRDENRIGTLTFTIWPNHSEYGNVRLRMSRICVYDGSELIFRCRPVNRKKLFHGGIEYQCEGLEGAMNDAIYRPNAYGTPGGLLSIITWIIAAYNSAQPDSTLNFRVGHVTTVFDAELEEDEKFAIDDFSPCWDVLMESTVNRFGGYIVPRYEDGGNYIDFFADSDEAIPEAGQEIVFGQNLEDLSIDANTEGMFTRLIPLGADVKAAQREIDLGASENTPLTIEHATNKREYYESENDDFIQDTEAVGLYGIIERVERWEKIESANKLYNKGWNFFQKNFMPFAESITLNAVDLRDAGVDAGSMRWMHRVRVVSARHGLDRSKSYLIKRESIRLGNPDGNRVQLGATKASPLTDITEKGARASRTMYDGLSTRVFGLENPSAE